MWYQHLIQYHRSCVLYQHLIQYHSSYVWYQHLIQYLSSYVWIQHFIQYHSSFVWYQHFIQYHSSYKMSSQYKLFRSHGSLGPTNSGEDLWAPCPKGLITETCQLGLDICDLLTETCLLRLAPRFTIWDLLMDEKRQKEKKNDIVHLSNDPIPIDITLMVRTERVTNQTINGSLPPSGKSGKFMSYRGFTG